jgi:hypothetical protein
MSQTDYPRRMRLKYLPTSVLVVWLLFATSARAQDNPLEDPDLQQLLKQAQEMQKNARDLQKSPGSPDTRKKLAEMEAMAKEQAAQQEQEEKDEKEKLQAALKKQLEAPGPVAFPDWTPVTPEFKPAGKPTKKLVDEEVKIVQTGTSLLTPEQLANSWESATVVKERTSVGAGTTSTLTAKSPGSFSQHPDRSGRKSRTGSLPRAQQQSDPGRKSPLPCRSQKIASE